ncbi:helix-turn-helix domain-containing protein [Pseudomonas oryzihabitans]|uniref:GlxA family transcriptional regulator n=1 Tax=Pseudomonas oryzihabitans TaxID=47885 RepID=UPI0028941B24|nr:helix-turn-helix domain-containing protein [Pseudomonas oryzihabitans]MDT3718872.1 helix-turn-helix domain-containing protein [Pseudomonas oryzihabitans]
MHIAILAYPGISPFLLSTPLAVFGEPFLEAGHQLSVCANPGQLGGIGGLALTTQWPLARAHEADVVILPGWRDADEPVSADLLEVLSEAAARGALVVGLCLGAFGLAAAGLLQGRRATTHWRHTEAFARRHPDIQVEADALFVDEGAVLTSAGLAAGLDCCLHLLGRLRGTGEANRVARHLVAAPQRAGTQAQLLKQPILGSSGARRLSEALEALRADPRYSPSLDELAARVGMSRRNLSRHLRERTGGGLKDWLRRMRVAQAQAQLAAGARGLESIASRCGFADAHALRAAFRTELGLTPMQWLAQQPPGSRE